MDTSSSMSAKKFYIETMKDKEQKSDSEELSIEINDRSALTI